MKTGMAHMKIAILLLLQLVILSQVEAKGQVEVRFKTYDNPGGKEESGHCCDGKWGICEKHGCDHMFIVCMDDASSSDETENCRYGKIVTGASKDRDSVTFASLIGDTRNPLLYNFTGTIPAQMALKVDVWDKDKTGKNDHVEFLRKNLRSSPQAVADKANVPYTLRQRTRLDLQVRVVCSTNYYGVSCDVLCRPPEPGQHYTCDRLTGRKICEPGWTEERCTGRVQQCESSRCRNGGTCIVFNGQKTCQCMESFTGSRCEQHICDQRCAPGTCTWWEPGPNGYECHCPRGYTARKLAGGVACMERRSVNRDVLQELRSLHTK